MADHKRSSTKHQRSTHLSQSRSGKSAHIHAIQIVVLPLICSTFFFLPWSTHAYATHTYSFQTLRNLIIFIHLDALPYTCHHYRQKTVISIVTNLRTALIVTTRTIVLMGLFVPPERNVHHNRWIGDDTVRTITRAIAILNQRSVKHDSSLQEKKKS